MDVQFPAPRWRVADTEEPRMPYSLTTHPAPAGKFVTTCRAALVVVMGILASASPLSAQSPAEQAELAGSTASPPLARGGGADGDYTDGYLWYTQRPLEVGDFRGDVPDKRPLEEPRIEAYSHIELRYSYQVATRRRGTRWRVELADVEVHALFHRGKSWNAQPTYAPLLDHHQGHFDLAELVAREAQRQLRQGTRPPRQLMGQGASEREAAEDLERQIQRQLAGHVESLERDIDYFDQIPRYGTLPDIEARERQKQQELLRRHPR
jgi:hypothetical protein